MIRRAAKKDANHGAIVDALRGVGCGVVDLAAVGCGVPDLLVCAPTWPHTACLIEVKNLKGRGNKLTEDQVRFHAEWKGRIHVVTSVAEALRAVDISA